MSPTYPPRLLKADAARGLSSRIVFNYDDLRLRCDEYVEHARAEVRRMWDEARCEIDDLRGRVEQEAREAGRNAGLADAERQVAARTRAAAEESVAERLGTVLPALQAAAAELAAERDRWLTEWEQAAVRLGVGIAEKLLRRRLDCDPDLALESLAGTLQLAAGSPRITIRLNPQDLASLGARTADITRTLSPSVDVELCPDESITRGGSVIETEHGTIDARLETQLDRIAGELLGE
ncbi:MAG: hypothetical protein KY476_05275 [Planctomycetes bacterium]|nr:hypothetical protein [Planctomycetota bacterium]